jgi:putative FmdB family regulatory protein
VALRGACYTLKFKRANFKYFAEDSLVPLYEYECQKCGRHTDKIEPVNGPHLKKCPQCGGKVESVITAPSIKFKGSGWYVTDYAGKSALGESPDKSDSSKGEKESAEKPSGEKGEKSEKKEASAKESSSKDGKSKESSKESKDSKAVKKK